MTLTVVKTEQYIPQRLSDDDKLSCVDHLRRIFGRMRDFGHQFQ